MGLPPCLSGKDSACQCRRCGFDPWVRKIPWRRKGQPTSVFLPGASHWQRSLVGHSPWGHKELEMVQWLNHHHHHVISVTTFCRVCITNEYGILSKAFSASIEIIVWCLFFNLLMWYITLIGLWKNPCTPEINPTLSWCMVLLMYSWIWIASIFFFSVFSLSDFHNSVF